MAARAKRFFAWSTSPSHPSSNLHYGCLFSTFYNNSKNLAAPKHMRWCISPIRSAINGRPGRPRAGK